METRCLSLCPGGSSWRPASVCCPTHPQVPSPMPWALQRQPLVSPDLSWTALSGTLSFAQTVPCDSHYIPYPSALHTHTVRKFILRNWPAVWLPQFSMIEKPRDASAVQSVSFMEVLTGDALYGLLSLAVPAGTSKYVAFCLHLGEKLRLVSWWSQSFPFLFGTAVRGWTALVLGQGSSRVSPCFSVRSQLFTFKKCIFFLTRCWNVCETG